MAGGRRDSSSRVRSTKEESDNPVWLTKPVSATESKRLPTIVVPLRHSKKSPCTRQPCECVLARINLPLANMGNAQQ